MARKYKNTLELYKKMLDNLIEKYDVVSEHIQNQLVSMASELGYWKSFNHPERKKLQLKLDLYTEMYNDLVELEEALNYDDEI